MVFGRKTENSDAPQTESAATLRRRKRLLSEIESEFRYTGYETGEPEIDPHLIEALLKVPRDAFVPPNKGFAAYNNIALSIGHGQTISQPYIVAIMTQLLHLAPADVVLEVGTGSGYQAAVLAELATQVYTIETVPELAHQAARRLEQMGYPNVEVMTGDGGQGWPEHAPFDKIIVTAAGPQIPKPLIDQLKPGGRMVIPVGPFGYQNLMVIDKGEDGAVTKRAVLPVAFVPLVSTPPPAPKWEHFEHKADMGVRGIAPTLAIAFEQAALALTAVVTDPDKVNRCKRVEIQCSAPDDEILLVDWLNAVIFEMATRKMLFGRFYVEILGGVLEGTAWGEPVDVERHAPVVEPKGATFTELKVKKTDGGWVAQCVIDV